MVVTCEIMSLFGIHTYKEPNTISNSFFFLIKKHSNG